MRIALFSDVHGNLPALEACLADMAGKAPDAIYCLGDLVGYQVWPNEVVDMVRGRGIPTIAGNYDYGIGRNGDDCGCAYKSEEEKGMGKISISYTNSVTGITQREYLRTLPSQIRLDYRINEQLMSILLVHGSPRKINEYLFEDREEKSLLRILQQANADILCFGHTHKPYHRILTDEIDGITHYRHAINTGSVGKPKDGDPRGCYVLVDINEQADNTVAESVKVTFVRFEYDIEKAAVAIEQSPLPDEYAAMLRRGY